MISVCKVSFSSSFFGPLSPKFHICLSFGLLDVRTRHLPQPSPISRIGAKDIQCAKSLHDQQPELIRPVRHRSWRPHENQSNNVRLREKYKTAPDGPCEIPTHWLSIGQIPAPALSWGQAAWIMIFEKSIRSVEPIQVGKFDYRSTLGKPSSKTACKIGFEASRSSWKIASSTKQRNVKTKSMRLGKLGMCLYISSNNVESSCESIKALPSDVRGGVCKGT